MPCDQANDLPAVGALMRNNSAFGKLGICSAGMAAGQRTGVTPHTSSYGCTPPHIE
jgi:hypothetical protein